MNTDWVLKTNGKPLETVQEFVAGLWQELDLTAMMVPLKGVDLEDWKTTVIDSPEHLKNANPFTPLMTENIASSIPGFLTDHPEGRLAILLRPCELRAFQVIKKRMNLDDSRIVTISSDCLGTFPSGEYFWRLERKGAGDSLSDEALHFSRSGGIAPYRYRIACQLCQDPISRDANINLHIVGIPVRDKIFVSTRNGKAALPDMEILGAEIAVEEDIRSHERVSERMVYRNLDTRDRLTDALVNETSLDLVSLVDQLNTCGRCQLCMDVCPICTTSNIHRDADGFLDQSMVAEWVVACAGCGMCEEACHQHRPLSAIFSVVREKLEEIHAN